jgi:replicative DNA helicase
VIFQAIQSLYTAGDPIDLLTVHLNLKNKARSNDQAVISN